MDLATLKLSDLYIECDECKGGGWVNRLGDPNVRQGFGTHVVSSSGPCEKCNGLGGKLTPTGEVLARFMDALKKMHRL